MNLCEPSVAVADAQVALRFTRAGAPHTWISHQRAAYPYHVGRNLRLPGDPPGMASVYLQCCSGGLFENDDLLLRFEAQERAHAQVAAPAATVVHSMRGTHARQHVTLTARPQSHLEYLPDSLILFPSAHLVSQVEVVLHEQASVIATEMVLAHDPAGQSRAFERLESAFTVRDARGARLVRDRWTMSGTTVASRTPGITGQHRAQATFFALRRGGSQDLVEALRAAVPEDRRLYIAVSALPNDCGAMARALSMDEPLLRACLRALQLAARIALGISGAARAPATGAVAQPAG